MISAYSRDAARSSADSVRHRIGEDAPEIAIILGSSKMRCAFLSPTYQDFRRRPWSVTRERWFRER